MAKRNSLFARLARRPSRKPSRVLSKKADGVPGPSENPVTNFLLADIAIRAGGYLARRGVEKSLLANRYGKQTAKDIVENKTLAQTLISLALARIASRSVPGAIIVGGGALAKTLIDRRKGRRRAKAEGDRELIEQAHGD